MLGEFIDWATGSRSQADLSGGSGRAFRRRTAWCRRHPRPQPASHRRGALPDLHRRDVVDPQVGPPGSPQSHPLNRLALWAASESAAAYQTLLAPIAPPDLVATDVKALRSQCPDTPIQRCLIHVHRGHRPRPDTAPQDHPRQGPATPLSQAADHLHCRGGHRVAGNSERLRHPVQGLAEGSAPPTPSSPSMLKSATGCATTEAPPPTTRPPSPSGHCTPTPTIPHPPAASWPPGTPRAAPSAPAHPNPKPPSPAPVRTPPDGGTTPTPEEGLWARKGWAGRTH